MISQKYFTISFIILLSGVFFLPISLEASDSGVDLMMMSISVSPASPDVDDTVTITVRGKNNGTALLDSGQGIKNFIYSVSDFDTTNDVKASLSHSPTSFDPLDPGDEFTYSIQGSFSSSGGKTIWFKIDSDKQLSEPNENNNYISQTVTIGESVSSSSDLNLKMKSISVSPYRPVIGERVTATFSGICYGTTTLDHIVINPSYSLPDFELENDLPASLSPYPSNNNLWTAWQSFEYSAVGYFNSAGDKTLSFVLNTVNGYTDSDVSNNDMTKIVTVLPVLDLSVESIAVTESEVFDSFINIEADIKNSGASFSSNFGVEAYINNISAYTYSYSNGIDSGETRVHGGTVPLSKFRNGENEVKVEVVDISEKEANLDNNILTTTFTVVIEEPEPLPEPAPVVTPEPEPTPTPSPTPTTLTSADQKVLERIQKLGYQVSAEERVVVEEEKQSSQTTNWNLVEMLKGKILLQVEEHGEAWYLDSETEKRFYLKDGDSAYTALGAFGLGISNADISKIPIGIEERAEIADFDNDGLDDRLEETLGTEIADPDSDNDGHSDGEEVKIGYNPLGSGTTYTSASFANSFKGKILLQVEEHGEAWYVNPVDAKRYYMKDGNLAYQIMRFLSLGITNSDLRQIPVGEFE